MSWLDRIIRRFNMASQIVAVLLLYAVGSTALAIAAAPSIILIDAFAERTSTMAIGWHALAIGIAFGIGFFVSGITLLIVVPIYNFILPTRVKPFRGGYFTIAAVPWYVHNGLFYLVRFTFLPFVTFTPFGTLFLRAMGMKVGKRVHINTENISDPRLISLGDDCVLGGSARIFAHYAGGGHLNIAPVKIGARATIGVNATIMGDVVIGRGAVILPHSVVLPGSRIADGERWGGVPAVPMGTREMRDVRRRIHHVAG